MVAQKITNQVQGQGDITVSPSERFKEQFKRTKLCRFFFGPGCKRGSACMFAHTEEELQQRPDLQCTSMCPMLTQNGECTNPECQFAHDKSELKVTNVFYKTGLCKDFQKGECKLGDMCRHAHMRDELRDLPPQEKHSRRSSKSSSPSNDDSFPTEQDGNFIVDESQQDTPRCNPNGGTAVRFQQDFQQIAQRAPRRRVTAPAKLQKDLQNRKFEYGFSSDETTDQDYEIDGPSNYGSNESNSNYVGQASPQMKQAYQDYVEAQRAAHEAESELPASRQSTGGRRAAQVQAQRAAHEANKSPKKKSSVTFGAAWTAGNNFAPQEQTCIIGFQAPMNFQNRGGAPYMQEQEGHQGNSQVPRLIPPLYMSMPRGGQALKGRGQTAHLLTPVVPHAGLNTLERNEIVEKLLRAQPEYYDD